MKDHIYTIPILDALREPDLCPFCTIYKNLENNTIDFIMGPAYMDEDIRNNTNEAGFCDKHLQRLYTVQNRLGAALMIHTHLKHLQKNINISVDKLDIHFGRFFKKTESAAGKLNTVISVQQKRCYICEKINETFLRYIDTFFYMWVNDYDEIKDLVEKLPGFCIPHYGLILSEAERLLGKKHLENFLTVIIHLQNKTINGIENDLDWFIQKFDYRNADAPWKNSKDALIRAIALLKGADIK